jgi:WD40 repeat protein
MLGRNRPFYRSFRSGQVLNSLSESQNKNWFPSIPSIRHVLPLPGEQRVITYAWDGSFRVWHLERSTQVGEEWEDKDESVKAMALSLDGKMVASGEFGWCSEIMEHRHGQGHQRMDGAYGVRCICWSLDGERVVSGSSDGPFRVRDIKSDTTPMTRRLLQVGKC